MSLPPRAFYSLTEISDRWGCVAADLAGWAATDHLTLVTSIASVICGKQPVAGIVVVTAADMMRMFRRHGPSDDECRVFRIRPQGSTEWQYITEPADGLLIKITDLMLLAGEVQKFEDERDLQRRPFVSPGSAPRYDWEGMNIMLFRRINDQGVPATQAELIAEVQDWFAQTSPTGDIPEESTTRKKIAPIWRALRERE
ncbi:hypothetical protein [Yoonia vestfoldensis]|jgi:hypothetical protein|uniref:hypothetical protein n=1 Tax=Yoonia vestfoldensis TaxID=245188 RepID=UPI0003A34A41|nr:hypothetical protein [Yoonia vestfoldensis]